MTPTDSFEILHEQELLILDAEPGLASNEDALHSFNRFIKWLGKRKDEGTPATLTLDGVDRLFRAMVAARVRGYELQNRITELEDRISYCEHCWEQKTETKTGVVTCLACGSDVAECFNCV